MRRKFGVLHSSGVKPLQTGSSFFTLICIVVAPSEITKLLVQWRRREPGALNRLMPVVYDDLRTLAVRRLRHESKAGMRPTELVSEVFMRFARERQTNFPDRARFFAASNNILKRVLVDLARLRNAAKRQGTLVSLDLAEGQPSAPLLAGFGRLDDAVNALAKLDPLQARLVRLRFSEELTIEATAVALNISLTKANREWRSAKAWLLKRLSEE